MSGGLIAALVLMLLVFGAVVAFLLFSPSGKTVPMPTRPGLSSVKPGLPEKTVPKDVIKPPSVVPLPPHKEHDYYPPAAAVSKAEKPVSGAGSSALMAIIIDDMGSSLSEAKLLAAIRVPLTFAIIPGLRVDKDVAAYAVTNKIETMIHVPMQSKGWPERRLEANGLLVAMDADELQERMSGFVQQFPGAVGVNNHMGSEFTAHEEKMAVVLQELKKKSLFFIDSVTSPDSAGLRVAQRLGIKSARRNVFLDNEQERGYILGQINQAARLARKNGSVIAICHPHPVTIATLAAALPELAGQGVLLVPASRLVK